MKIAPPPPRVREDELMDAEDLAPHEHRHALRGLGRINTLSLAHRFYQSPLRRIMAGRTTPARVLDVACGGGGSTVHLARFARRHGLQIEVTGLDISHTALAYAEEHARSNGVSAAWMQRDVLRDGLPDGFDIIVSSLFLHHLTEHDAEEILRQMACRARHAVIVCDLLRTRLGSLLAHLVPPLLTRSHIVHVDAVLSARAAFTRAEVCSMAAAAGMRNARLTRHWPERFVLTWQKEHGPS